MVLHFAPYPPIHASKHHQPEDKGYVPALPHLSTKATPGTMTSRYTPPLPDESRDGSGGNYRHTRRSETNCILRHTVGRATSPDNIGITPALQRARDAELQARKSPAARPVVTLPSFRESFPVSLSELELTPTCGFNGRHEKQQFKAGQFPATTPIPRPPWAIPHKKDKSQYRSNEPLPYYLGAMSRSFEHPTKESIGNTDVHSLPPPSDDDTSSVSSSSGLDSNAEANYSPMPRSATEYRYPPLLPGLGPQRQPGHFTPQYLNDWDNYSAPPSSSTSISNGRRDQFLDNTQSPSDRLRRAQSRPTGNNVLKWLDYAEEIRDESGAVYYQCRWERGGRLPTACDYRAQKQAMKRHVEATHLKFKPHKCSFCQKAYSQKTALEVHEATHTGATPHECTFSCGLAFSDPARRYRHHVEAHGYVPRQTNKKHGNAQMRVVREKVQYGA